MFPSQPRREAGVGNATTERLKASERELEDEGRRAGVLRADIC